MPAAVTIAADRLGRTPDALTARRVAALLVGAGPDLRALTSYHALPLERLTLFVVRADGRHTLVVPSLERARADEVDLPRSVTVVDVGETENPYEAVSAALEGVDPDAPLAVGDHLWSRFLLELQAHLPRARWVRGTAVMADLRMRKTPEEVAALRRAGGAIDLVHRQVPALLRPGRTEAEVAEDIAAAILAAGHESVDFVIVGSGPNGASPHHETGDRVITAGDAVVVDIGGTMDGYCSDCTRNYFVGEVGDEVRRAHDALEAAQRAACDAVRPGVTAGQVDRAARDHLNRAGYGELFIHRTGHGIGMETHEEPYITAGSEQVLEPGMTFSVEPGLYVANAFGLRIEDIVAVTDDGVERLNVGERGAVRV